MENNQQDKSKPQILLCGVKIETAIFEIAFLIGLLWSAFYIFIFFYFCDNIFLKFVNAFLACLCTLLVYYPIFEIIREAKHVNINKRGDSCETIQDLKFSLFFMSLLLGYVAFQIGQFNHELRRAPCDSSGQCPEWSNRCPKNFAQLLSIDSEPKRKACSYPNEGIVERVFEGPEKLRFLKRKILEMAANHTNLTTTNNETLLELQLKPYFDVNDDNNTVFDSIEDKEANCILERGKWMRNVLCAEKVAKLKQAFMDVYWAQVKKKQQTKMRSSQFRHQNSQITEDEIDAIFVVPYNCDSLQRALKISIAFLCSHLIIFVIFIQQLLRYFDWTIKCPFKCFTGKRSGDQLCPIRKTKNERSEPAEKKQRPPSYQYALANCLEAPKKMYQNEVQTNFVRAENIYVTPNFENCQILRI